MTSPHRILVASENTTTINQLREFLQSQDFDMRAAATSAEINEIADGWPADLVICEETPADASGFDMAGYIRRRMPRARLLVITNSSQSAEFMRPARDRPVAFLVKPFDARTLVEHVQGSLGLGDSYANRRDYNRFAFSMESSCIVVNPFDDSEGRPVPALMRDVSLSGLSMLVRQVIPVPSMIKLVVQLPRQHSPIQILCKSVSCTMTQIPGVYRLGVKFIGLLPQELEDMMLAGGSPDTNGSTDIFLGKTFKAALREWIHAHSVTIADLAPEGTRLEDLVEELAKDASHSAISAQIKPQRKQPQP